MLAAILGWTVVWWICEPVPLCMTALASSVLCVVLGVEGAKKVFAPYSDPIIYLFLGSFILAEGMAIHGLDKRFAYHIMSMKAVGNSTGRILAAFGFICAFVSMWISNTATAIMMLPVAISIVNIIKDKDSKTNKAFFTCLLLGIAYGANIGGIATIIGTPPNTVYKGLSESLLNKKVGFLEWMILGVPLSLLMLWLSYLLMVNVFFKVKTKTLPEVADLLDKQAEQLGKIKSEEKRTLIVFSCAIFFWVFAQPLNHLIESLKWPFKIEEFSVALIFGGILFLIPKAPKSKQKLLAFNDFKYIGFIKWFIN